MVGLAPVSVSRGDMRRLCGFDGSCGFLGIFAIAHNEHQRGRILVVVHGDNTASGLAAANMRLS